MRIILTGGGTGGHIYPALAIAKELRERHPDVEILYIGSETGLEARLVPKSGIPFESIEISGFRRSLSFENVKTVYRFLKGVRRSRSLIRSFSADAVIGTGGYVCGPVVYAAAKQGIPTLIHEQNVIPGLTNKFLAKYVSRIAVSFTGSAQYFPTDKVVVTGNPRATEVAKADPTRGRSSLALSGSKRLVLVVGGSRGARAINEAFIEAIPQLEKQRNTHFVYVTGEVHYEQVKQMLEQSGQTMGNISVFPYIYNMPEVLATTELIINRAGASFLAEITSLGIPSILIPSPYVTNNHQEKNARWLEGHGAAAVLLERDLTANSLVTEIEQIVHVPQRLQLMKQAAKKLGEPQAADKIYEEIQKLMRR
ncbi:undecaprenyldiphospho-muramoylpentapeptide beta-N-acetylglucosaminyltransferase [Ammoniphilus oxalaticus]|uniref:UDP-N-acetylglucosamine--N-acetylmuramyl-(pentapeptide) pyrophosphoryl-undecaprenol N-acetylglucosamine transferase n=1 Tax=Ammoniphilus oxalaticus TaxID=66863 RepID=A0A419SJG9_9BACL|nr:undecaprenyldiphospho-muramoylpentapeptide beta-N-acetylglucosaminyltransferase [Ammoniphilus oxalaticus]RKD24100.1 undecaprenyldiphospho-muramoylpentapeptide beta-N-acetylglucosaminyltransferase [Ammoniphilus oxalaticus]